MSIKQYKGAHILGTPTKKYPHMVQIIKASKALNSLVGNKYITETHCITSIDRIDTERLIEYQKIRATKELQSWVITND